MLFVCTNLLNINNSHNTVCLYNCNNVIITIYIYSVFRSVLSIFLLLIFLGTIVDVFGVSKRSKKLAVRLLNCFSLYTNATKVLSTKRIEGSLDCIHGLRFFSMCWVVLGHTWFVLAYTPPDNIFDMADVSF